MQSCRICGRSLEEILDLGNMPLAGAFTEPNDFSSSTLIPLKLAWCSKCLLLQTGESVDRDVLFKDYSYHSSVASPLVTHFDNLATVILSYLPERDAGLVIDIGCNDGVLLNPLHRVGTKCLGVDPSDVAKEASVRNGWDLVNDYLSPGVAQAITLEYGKASIVVASNVFAHNDDIHSLAEAVSQLLLPEGIFICEVHYVGDLFDQVQFDTLYHEHAVYYSAEALRILFRMHGMNIWSIFRIPTHSGSIRVYASLEGHNRANRVPGILHQEVDTLDPFRFRDQALQARRRISEVVSVLNQAGSTVWAYGAAGRCTVLLNWCNLTEDLIPCVVDTSPRRYGRFVPGVHIPIVSPNALDYNISHRIGPDAIMVTAWNYFDDIVKQHPNFRGWWMKPLPRVEIV